MTERWVEQRTDLSDRIDVLGWGLLFVAIGAVSLVPSLPEGAWLIAAGLVMLGASAVRAGIGLPVRGLTVVVGVVASAAGIFIAVGLTSAVGPLVLIVLGVTLIVGTLHGARDRMVGTPVAPIR